MKRLRQLGANGRGSTVTEFALVSPMVIMLILAALEFGSALRANAGLRDLAGWAGRCAVISYALQSNDLTGAAQLKKDIEGRGKRGAYNLGNGTLVAAVTSVQDTTLLTVNKVRVHLTYGYPISIPFLPAQTIGMDVDRTFYVPNSAAISSASHTPCAA